MTKARPQIWVSIAFGYLCAIGLAAHAGSLNVDGNLAVNSNLTAQSLNVGGPISSTNTTSIGAAGQVVISTLWGSPNVFGIALTSSNAVPRIGFVAAGAEGGGFGFFSKDLGYLGSLWVRSEDQWLQCNLPGFRSEGSMDAGGNLSAGGSLSVGCDAEIGGARGGSLMVWGDVQIDGKLNLNGGMDPPYLLLDAETRGAVAKRVAQEVLPSKQTGAALFWNASVKRLEVYVASEGAFYDLAGNVVTNIAPPKVAGATVTKTFRVDSMTGEVVAHESVQAPRWRVKSSYRFDDKTGVFTFQASSNATPVVVTREEALEVR